MLDRRDHDTLHCDLDVSHGAKPPPDEAVEHHAAHDGIRPERRERMVADA